MKNKYIGQLILFIAPVFVLYSCNFNEPTAPRWDVSLNVPIAKKHYTLYDIIEKKSSGIKHYTEGPNQNLLYYTDIKKLDQITVNDELKIEDFSDSKTKEIGIISVAPDSVLAGIGYEWVGVSVSPGMQVALSGGNNTPVSVNFDPVNQFQTARIESGDVELAITNHMPSPVTLTISNLSITNNEGGDLIVNSAASVVIPSLQTVKAPAMGIARGTLIKNRLTLKCNISNTSSGGLLITLPNNSLTVKVIIKNIKVSDTVAKISKQDPININGLVNVDENSTQPTKFQNVKLENGTLNLTLKNNLDVDANATITMFNIKDPVGAALTSTRTIPRKQSVKAFDNFSLKNFSIVSADGNPSNVIEYSVSFEPLASYDYRTVKSTDDVIGNVNFTNLQVKEFLGQLKPTTLEQTRSSVSLDVKDLQNKLQFQQINLKNPVVELRLKPSAQVEFSINGRMEARNSIGQRSVMTLSSRTLNKTLVTSNDTIITLNPDSVSNFFKKFSKFPDSLTVYAGGVINPNYKTISVKKSDEVTGQSKIEFPLEFGISGGEFSDSLEIDLSKDDRDKIKDVNSLEASLNVSNGIPAQFGFSGKLFDEFNNFLMYFPPKHNDQDTVISISGAATANNGNVVSKTDQTVKIKIINGEPEKLSRAKYMRIRLRFDTSGPNNAPVKFKTDDTIDISIPGLINYKVKN